MSVLIKGMEMPDRCFSCPMCDVDCCGISKGSYIEYSEVEIDIAIDHRPEWCPLFPVQEHGRLIDADALFKKARYRMGIKPGGIEEVEAFIRATDLLEAPTIIPADEMFGKSEQLEGKEETE